MTILEEINSEPLNEKLLGEVLKIIFPDYVFIHDKYLKLGNIKCRPDYFCEDLKLIVEFNGYRHYSDIITINRDIRKKKAAKENGYLVIEIPYFIQMQKTNLEYFFHHIKDFNKQHNICCDYPTGFISNIAMLPVNFCEAGYKIYSSLFNNTYNFDRSIDKIEDEPDFNENSMSYLILTAAEKYIKLKIDPELYDKETKSVYNFYGNAFNFNDFSYFDKFNIDEKFIAKY